MFLVLAKVMQALVKRHQRSNTSNHSQSCISFLHVAKSQNQQKRTVQKAEMTLSLKTKTEKISVPTMSASNELIPKKLGETFRSSSRPAASAAATRLSASTAWALWIYPSGSFLGWFNDQIHRYIMIYLMYTYVIICIFYTVDYRFGTWYTSTKIIFKILAKD